MWATPVDWRLDDDDSRSADGRRDWRIRAGWVRDDGLWIEIREEVSDGALWLVDATGFRASFGTLGEALDAAYRRQAERDGT